MGKVLAVAPTSEPVTLDEAKAQCRIDHADEDTLITGLIKAAREHSEKYCQRAFITQTWDMFLDRFHSEIEVPLPPLKSITSIKYIDTSGVEQTLDTSKYTVDTSSFLGRVVPAYGESWPSARCVPNAVTVRFVAGYGDAGTDVPEAIKLAIKMLVGHLYVNREATSLMTVKDVPLAYDALLNNYRVITF